MALTTVLILSSLFVVLHTICSSYGRPSAIHHEWGLRSLHFKRKRGSLYSWRPLARKRPLLWCFPGVDVGVMPASSPVWHGRWEGRVTTPKGSHIFIGTLQALTGGPEPLKHEDRLGFIC